MGLQQTRGMLARCLATENLLVEHSSNVSTASFDTEKRILTLPVHNINNEFVYNMLVGHEVGHALYTPQNWALEIPDDVPYDFVNVVEDVRIEKLIQSKFPGLRRDFTKGYDELNKQDFFSLKNENIAKMSLIDRINLHFKLGSRAFIPLSDEEMVYVRACDEADTFDKVVLVAKMLADRANNQAKDNIETPQPQEEGGEESIESENTSGKKDDSNVSDEVDGADNSTTKPDETESKTQRSMDESLEKLVDKSIRNTFAYVSPPTINVDNFFTPIDEIREHFEAYVNDSLTYQHYVDDYKDYISSCKRDINYMVTQFEMKKSADAYSRQQVHKTGVLNTERLHEYKLTDDLFMRQTITPDGKSHGMVMYLDWSGSMSGITNKTTKQILLLVQFCRKVQIPYEVYTFTTGDGYLPAEDGEFTPNEVCMSEVKLVQVLTSTAKSTNLDKDMFNLYCASKYVDRDYSAPISPHLSMGGTPLNNAMFLVPSLIERFKKITKVQKVSFVCLTDGESSPVTHWTEHGNPSYAYYQTVMIRDGHRVYPLDGNNISGKISTWIQSKVSDVTITNIFIGSMNKCSNYLLTFDGYYPIEEPKFRKELSYTLKNVDGWPLVALVDTKSFNTTDDDIKVEDGASKIQIRSALRKMLKSKSSSKKLLTTLVGQFA